MSCNYYSSNANSSAVRLNNIVTDTTTFSNYLGINGFEWNVLQNPADPSNVMKVYEPKMELIQSFAGFRHYLDWEKIESLQGKYTFAPTHAGGWNLDAMYQGFKNNGIDMLVCLKTCPNWLLKTYPANQRDAENVPMPYGADKRNPKSYLLQAKAGFQFAARYGSNKHVDTKLVSVDTSQRWTADSVNQPKTGLNTVKYIECDNERDKWWKGDKAHQTAEEYAANLSAFYDGHKGTLGKGVGVKAADSNMTVVMAGLADPNPEYVQKVINWCKANRGYKLDGSIDLCFDVINYHYYPNDHSAHWNNKPTTGVAPELSEALTIANRFVTLGKKYKLPVWVTELGYDINNKSTQRAISIDNKSNLLTQANWLLRAALLYARCGIKKMFFYELYDDNPSATQYATSGLLTNDLKRRPAANYFTQVKSLLGQYSYRRTLSNQPIVDEYKYGDKTIYCLVVPNQTGQVTNYTLKLPIGKQGVIHHLNLNAITTNSSKTRVANGSLTLNVTETPVFVELK